MPELGIRVDCMTDDEPPALAFVALAVGIDVNGRNPEEL